MTVSHLPELSAHETESLHDLYRHLHRNPELSMQEHATQERIEAELDALGIEHFRCGGTGVVGILENGEGPVVAFRADTDGLPIEERSGREYASEARGTLPDGREVPVMHGCGHDTHVVALLGALRALVYDTERWGGTLVAIFQPGEETAAGARAMVEDGLWDRAPRPEVVLGQHVSPARAGTVALAAGVATAIADSLRVTVRGRQTHGSQPQDGKDPIVAAASMVTSLQTIVSRELAPQEAAVVTVGTFHAGIKENIIPEEAEFTVNTRALSQETRDRLIGSIHRILRGEAMVAGIEEPVIEKIYDFPLNVNDERAGERVLAGLRSALGEEEVSVGPPMMGSEDFGWLGASIEVPSVFWWFGGFDSPEPGGPVNHSPRFAPDPETTLRAGTTAALASLWQWIGHEG
ncbi:amidohydrolase [Rothia sp. AR01]|uniref:Amidohydrolase n=1 Tax=Rothia santali TaxID=2949643 RepID=A0A9X2HCY5_9MICC|nr:amidohydrolase [Rothia santali]MCP3425985.1 amidohydrolase [Rothia santali]